MVSYKALNTIFKLIYELSIIHIVTEYLFSFIICCCFEF